MSDSVDIPQPLPDLPTTLAVDNPVKAAWKEYQKTYLARYEVIRARNKCQAIKEAVDRNNEALEKEKNQPGMDKVLQSLQAMEYESTNKLAKASATWNSKRMDLEKQELDRVNDMLKKKALFLSAYSQRVTASNGNAGFVVPAELLVLLDPNFGFDFSDPKSVTT